MTSRCQSWAISNDFFFFAKARSCLIEFLLNFFWTSETELPSLVLVFSGDRRLVNLRHQPETCRTPCAEDVGSRRRRWKCLPPSPSRRCRCTAARCRSNRTQLLANQKQERKVAKWVDVPLYLCSRMTKAQTQSLGLGIKYCKASYRHLQFHMLVIIKKKKNSSARTSVCILKVFWILDLSFCFFLNLDYTVNFHKYIPAWGEKIFTIEKYLFVRIKKKKKNRWTTLVFLSLIIVSKKISVPPRITC